MRNIKTFLEKEKNKKYPLRKNALHQKCRNKVRFGLYLGRLRYHFIIIEELREQKNHRIIEEP